MTGAQGQPGLTGAQGQAGVTGAQGRSGVAGVANPAPAGTTWTSLRDIMFDYNRPEIRSAEMSKISDIAAYSSQNRPFVSVSTARPISCAERINTTRP